MGSGTVIVNPSGEVTSGSGTSYSTPLIAGAMASLLQYAKSVYHYYSVSEILNAVFTSANHYLSPTTQTGYGIPDFRIAAANINAAFTSINEKKPSEKTILYHADKKMLEINCKLPDSDLMIFSITGNLFLHRTQPGNAVSLSQLAPGIYIIRFMTNDGIVSKKIIVN
jgi:hypothetical protein